MPKTTPWNSGHDGLRCSHFLYVVTVVLLKCGLLIDRMCLASEWMTNKTDKTGSPKQPHKGKPLPPQAPFPQCTFSRDLETRLQRRDFSTSRLPGKLCSDPPKRPRHSVGQWTERHDQNNSPPNALLLSPSSLHTRPPA